jgi:hypothetical protein
MTGTMAQQRVQKQGLVLAFNHSDAIAGRALQCVLKQGITTTKFSNTIAGGK